MLTPSYGYGRFIRDAIESVIHQQGVRLHHVIQDAGSQDGTVEILRSFDDRVEWASQPDRGQSDGLNKALAMATGEWIGWLNADEYYLPNALRVMVQAGEKHGADVVYGDCVTVDREGRMNGLRPQHPFSRVVLRLYGPFPASVSVLIRRSMLGEDPWDPSLERVMDWDLYLALESKGAAFHYVPYPVGAFRQHEDQASTGWARPTGVEMRKVRDRYAISTDRWLHHTGVVLHRLRKLAAGSYVRQVRASSFRGRDLRWFLGAEGGETFRFLLDRCYGIRRTPTAIDDRRQD